jgi:hypothetical protein
LKRLVFTVIAAMAISTGWIGTASADYALAPEYQIEMQGHSVVVCTDESFSIDAGACPDGDVMLREDLETGKVVALNSLCTLSQWDGLCFVDECVPRGTYRYGLEIPYECCDGCCGWTPFYGEFTVSADPGDCSPSEGNPGPSAYAKSTPWADSNDGLVCGPSDSIFDCSVAAVGSRMVLSVNAIAFLLGLLLLVRRRRP